MPQHIERKPSRWAGKRIGAGRKRKPNHGKTGIGAVSSSSTSSKATRERLQLSWWWIQIQMATLEMAKIPVY
eukprot:SAG11_NODE_17636_length_513_cov_0.743961_1_plen_71_part_10